MRLAFLSFFLRDMSRVLPSMEIFFFVMFFLAFSKLIQMNGLQTHLRFLLYLSTSAAKSKRKIDKTIVVSRAQKKLFGFSLNFPISFAFAVFPHILDNLFRQQIFIFIFLSCIKEEKLLRKKRIQKLFLDEGNSWKADGVKFKQKLLYFEKRKRKQLSEISQLVTHVKEKLLNIVGKFSCSSSVQSRS